MEENQEPTDDQPVDEGIADEIGQELLHHHAELIRKAFAGDHVVVIVSKQGTTMSGIACDVAGMDNAIHQLTIVANLMVKNITQGAWCLKLHGPEGTEPIEPGNDVNQREFKLGGAGG